MTAVARGALQRRPNILFVHSSAELYGADRILLELLAGLRDAGHGLQVVLPNPGPLHDEIKTLGVAVQRRNLGVLRRKYFSLAGLANRVTRICGAVRLLRTLISQQAIDVVHSNTTAVFAGLIAARLAHKPHVWHVHEITTRPLWFARLVSRCVGRFSDKAVFVSRATLEHMCQLNPALRAKAVLIYNGIDEQRARAGRPGTLKSELGWDEATKVVGMIGRINWWKGQDKLVDCAVRLAATHPALRFVMVGGVFDGDVARRDELLARIQAAGLQDKVRVLDFRPEIGPVLADLDVFVLPSTEPDPFPTVVLEAMAACRPVVAFRHGGVCEMVEDGVTGLLCNPCSSEEMSAAIAHLADDPATARRMGQAGRVRIEALFSRAQFVRQFSSLYSELAVA